MPVWTPHAAVSQTLVWRIPHLDHACLNTPNNCFTNGVKNPTHVPYLSKHPNCCFTMVGRILHLHHTCLNIPSCCFANNGGKNPTPAPYLSEHLQLLVLLALLLLTAADGEVGVSVLVLLQHLHRPCWQSWSSTTPLYSHARLVHALATPGVRQKWGGWWGGDALGYASVVKRERELVPRARWNQALQHCCSVTHSETKLQCNPSWNRAAV